MFKKLCILVMALSLFACSDANKTETKTKTETETKPAPAAVGEKYVEGAHYTLIEKPIATASGKIEVTEFFWYGCPHCEHFEPLLEAWEKTRPDDVVLIRSPAVWREPMKLHAQLFYLVQTLPNRDLVHSVLFAEIIALNGEKDMAAQSRKIAQFLAKFGVSENDYNQKIQSAEINAKVQSAIALFEQTGAGGTPTIMVNGKYLVNNQAVSSVDEIMAIADFLILKERAEKQ